MEKFKLCIVTLLSFLTCCCDKLSLPLILLLISNVIDTITGLWKAVYINEKITFKKISWGSIRKISMYILVIVGFTVDIIIKYTVENFGIQIGIKGIIGSLVAIWLVLDEQLSILRNLVVIKVPMPNFMSNLIIKLKDKVDGKGNI